METGPPFAPEPVAGRTIRRRRKAAAGGQSPPRHPSVVGTACFLTGATRQLTPLTGQSLLENQIGFPSVGLATDVVGRSAMLKSSLPCPQGNQLRDRRRAEISAQIPSARRPPCYTVVMNYFVQRIERHSTVVETSTDLPARRHQFGPIVATSQLSVDIEPRLRLSWQVLGRAWGSGFKLLIFRSSTGFSAESQPDDLNKHGQLFIETIHGGSHCEVPHEGTHFFSLVLNRTGLFGLWETQSILRFSETVPSAKVAIARIRDQIELHDMVQRHALGKIEFPAKLNEAKIRSLRSQRSLQEIEHPEPRKTQNSAEILLEEDLQYINAMIEAIFAKRKKISELENDERFRKLSPEERAEILERIAERLDAAEFSARWEMKRK